MATTTANTARVPSAPVPLGAALSEIPALPAVPDPVSRVEDSTADVLSAENALPVEEVRAEAYRLFVDRGGEDGHDVEDWLAAEELVRRRMIDREQ